MNKEDLGNNIYTRRKELGFTQKKVAEQMSVSIPQISKWEHGKAGITLKTFVKLSEVLKVPPEALLEGEISKSNNDECEDEKYELRKNRIVKLILCVVIIVLLARLGIRIYYQIVHVREENQFVTNVLYQIPLDDGGWKIRRIVQKRGDIIWLDLVTYEKNGTILGAEVIEVNDYNGNSDYFYEEIMRENANVFLVNVHCEENGKWRMVNFVIEPSIIE